MTYGYYYPCFSVDSVANISGIVNQKNIREHCCNPYQELPRPHYLAASRGNIPASVAPCVQSVPSHG
jgi:hypothetical protein